MVTKVQHRSVGDCPRLAGRVSGVDEVCTERLRLRRFQAGDAEAFAAINADPLVARYLYELSAAE
jgi:RimJ/RimL family protein N-acetyltransferase